jgi:hypothetical protein
MHPLPSSGVARLLAEIVAERERYLPSLRFRSFAAIGCEHQSDSRLPQSKTGKPLPFGAKGLNQTGHSISVQLRTLEGCGNEAGEERMRMIWLGLKLGVELSPNVERMIRQLDDFHKSLFGGN